MGKRSSVWAFGRDGQHCCMTRYPLASGRRSCLREFNEMSSILVQKFFKILAGFLVLAPFSSGGQPLS